MLIVSLVVLLFLKDRQYTNAIEQHTKTIKEKEYQIVNLNKKLTKKEKASDEQKTTTVKKTTKPDGTVIEETQKSENSSKVFTDYADTFISSEEKAKSSESVETKTVVIQKHSKYSLGVYMGGTTLDTIQMDIGARIGDLPLEIVGGGKPLKREAYMGVRIEW